MSQKFRGGSQAGQVSWEPFKKAALWIVFGFMAFIMLSGLAVYQTFYANKSAKKATTPLLGTGQTAGTTTTTTKPAPRSVVLKYGSVMVEVGKGAEVDIPPGEAIVASPIATVDFDWYVDGKLFQRYRAGKVDQKFSLDTPNVRKVAYVLPESSQVQTIKFVYCRYRGPDVPEGWYPKALAAGNNRL